MLGIDHLPVGLLYLHCQYICMPGNNRNIRTGLVFVRSGKINRSNVKTEQTVSGYSQTQQYMFLFSNQSLLNLYFDCE